MQIKEEIRKLIELQKIDSHLLNLKQQKDIIKPGELAQLRETLESKKTELSSKEETIKQIQIKRKEKELDLETREEAIRKAQVQLYQLKTNQEYKAKLREIESLKADVSIVEEDIIRILDELEKKNKELREVQEKLQEEESKIKKEISKIEAEIKDLEAEIKNLENKRNILASEVDKNVLKKYEYLLQHRGGLAIVPLRDGSCGGCFMNLPPEITNKVKQYKDLVQCEMCARLLYLEEDFNL
ncbi:MAG: hypothetical protein J7K71_01680 [Candidatus Omnitrophica bacterium]|nr:hypothetical protein [Candidatus Omnitrophota bacterium]